jgi:hypothetical protein
MGAVFEDETPFDLTPYGSRTPVAVRVCGSMLNSPAVEVIQCLQMGSG